VVAKGTLEGVTLDEVRRLVLDKSKELKITMKDMSEAVGMNGTFIHQFIRKGTPKYLPEEVRYKLAKVIGVSEELLRGRDLHVQPIETTQANARPNGKTRAAVGRADLDDMWTIWNIATPEERQLIIDLARQVVGRIKK
jgi:hypothetical protein